MRSCRIILLGLVPLSLQAPAQSNHTVISNPTAVIAGGTVVGTTTSLPAATASVNQFLGIPFAKSPPQRFSPPEPAAAFQAPLNTQKFAPACIQQFQYPKEAFELYQDLFNYPPPSAGESEDCLYLNVYAPSTPPPPGGRAVMFWIYGGNLWWGTGSLSGYDGSALAAYEDVIVVTSNYRTNVFGFLASSEQPLKERNAGILDQRAALQWVQDNIHAFGGDPEKVTIFGQSSGAFSVDAHVTAFNTSNAPFQAAIMQSRQASFNALPGDGAILDDNNNQAVAELAKLVNCTDSDIVGCLRAVPAALLKNVTEVHSISFPAISDNYTVMSNGAAQRVSGDFAQVPTLIGNTQDDGTVFVLGEKNLTEWVEKTIGTIFPGYVDTILKAFPTNATVTDSDQIATLYKLLNYQCAAALLADSNQKRNIPTWRYIFNASFPNFSPLNGTLGAWHTSEITLIFQTYPGGPLHAPSTDTSTVLPLYRNATAEQYAMSRVMSSAWADFAKNPYAGPGWGQWGSFDGNDTAMFGGTTGRAAGFEMLNNAAIDAQCEIIKPLFERYSNLTASEL